MTQVQSLRSRTIGASIENPRHNFARYVAIGDSSTEGLRDLQPDGTYRGWSRRLAQRIADVQGCLLYANLGVRGWTTRQILCDQVPQALAMRPDLVTVFSGTNDVLRRRWDLDSLATDMERIQRLFIDHGATVLTFTLPDLTPIIPLARPIAPRIQAMNSVLREIAQRTGTLLLDFAAYPVAVDVRLWDEDRIHANAQGHERIANALAFALHLPGSDDSWAKSLPPRARTSNIGRIGNEVSWMIRFLLPWLGRRMRLHSRTRLPTRLPQDLVMLRASLEAEA